ncbi:hypothetical protein DFH06DRAFT_1149916 [Mycena polygramma]|nr:hypothetical protein DFH06DRAFT_1149916 [Mycena polygramma]
MARSLCMECNHGKSLHKPPPQSNGETALGKGTVKDIFAAHSAKGLKDLEPLADYSTARNDALKGFQAEPEASTSKKSSKKGKAKAEPKMKDAPVKVVLLTNGVKNDKLKGSSRALTSSDVGHREQHGCVAKNVKIDRQWTNRECSRQFAKLFPKAFAEAKGDTTQASWSVVVKSYQQLRVVPKSAPPTGADVLDEKITTKHGHSMIYIGEPLLGSPPPLATDLHEPVLNKTVPERTYKTWYNSPPRQEPSSDVEEAAITVSDQSSTASDADPDSSNEDSEMELDPNLDKSSAYGMPYKMRPNPSSSKRKLESLRNATLLESDVEEKPFKKQKLASGKHRPTTGGSSGKQRDGSPSTNPPEVVPESPATKDESKKEECTSCRRLVSAPPKTVVARQEYPWDEEEILRQKSTHVNPWHPKCEYSSASNLHLVSRFRIDIGLRAGGKQDKNVNIQLHRHTLEWLGCIVLGSRHFLLILVLVNVQTQASSVPSFRGKAAQKKRQLNSWWMCLAKDVVSSSANLDVSRTSRTAGTRGPYIAGENVGAEAMKP